MHILTFFCLQDKLQSQQFIALALHIIIQFVVLESTCTTQNTEHNQHSHYMFTGEKCDLVRLVERSVGIEETSWG